MPKCKSKRRRKGKKRTRKQIQLESYENKYGKDMIRIYVDNDNKPKFEVLDSLGTIVRYNLIPE